MDIVSPEKRSKMMSGIRNVNTKPEHCVRKGLHARGFRYKLHDSSLPGKPDLVLPKYQAVIMVNGCFWHGHDCHLFKMPLTRQDFWNDKINNNRKRDLHVQHKLRDMHWRICVLWECALRLKGKHDFLLDMVGNWICSDERYIEISRKNIDGDVNDKMVNQR